MKKNKKAQLSEIFTDISSYFFVILLIILFSFLFKLNSDGTTQKIEGVMGKANANTLFLNYLKSPITQQDLTFADLISEYSLEQTNKKGELQKIIKEETTKFFEEYPGLKWHLFIADSLSGDKFEVAAGGVQIKENNKQGITSPQAVCITILSKNGDIAKLELLVMDYFTFNTVAQEREQFRKIRDGVKFDC